MDTTENSRAPRWWTAVEARLPPVLQGGRVTPSRTVAVGLVVLALVVAGGVTLLALRGRDRSVPLTATSSSTVKSAAPVPARSVAPDVVVEVVGTVVHPGVVRLPAGSRVQDAVDACGGVLPGTSTVDIGMARKLVDGEQIRVGIAGDPPAGTTSAGGGDGAAGGLVNLNTATEAQLDALPGVGPVLAQRILAWRTEHGRFDSVDQLQEVPGVGPKTFDDLEAQVTV